MSELKSCYHTCLNDKGVKKMKTFEISIDDSTYSNMLKEIEMLRLIDDIDISRSTFIDCAIYEFCVHRFALREMIGERNLNNE